MEKVQVTIVLYLVFHLFIHCLIICVCVCERVFVSLLSKKKQRNEFR